jgi:cephalosporin hydroxylase
MNKIKIEVQNGLDELMVSLTNEGFDVYKYGEAGLDADVTIITGIDEAYEEIEPAQFHKNGKKQMLVIDATNRTTQDVLTRVHRYF